MCKIEGEMTDTEGGNRKGERNRERERERGQGREK